MDKNEEKIKKILPPIITDRRQCVNLKNIMQFFVCKDTYKFFVLQAIFRISLKISPNLFKSQPFFLLCR